MTSVKIEKEYKLNLFDPSANSNKVWTGRAYSDGTFKVEFGRVREGGLGLMRREKKLANAAAAAAELEARRLEKIKKGYRETAVLNDASGIVVAQTQNLNDVAVKQIEGAEDKTTAGLIKYLADVNIHQITASTSIKYNSVSGAFSTPLGILTPAAINEARNLLELIEETNAHRLASQRRHESVCDYYRLVPSDFGARVPKSQELLDTADKINAQTQILDALDAALQSSPPEAITDKIFACRLTKVPHDTDEGRAAFRQVKKLYESSRGGHANIAKLKLIRLYEVEIESMKKDFEQASAKFGNVRSDLWHGTKASNLLSILKGGLQIPKSRGAHCTGTMFGSGIYTSIQSTKALNYATDFWNKSGARNQRTFMFLTEVALGKMCEPATGTSFPRPGFDSTWIKAGTCGVMNHECVVYDTKQINLKYLCEFGEA